MDERIVKLKEALCRKGLDGVLITSLENIRYISGFTSVDAELLITGDKKYIFTDFRYFIQAAEECPDFTLIEISNDNYYSKLDELLKENNCKKCGYEDDKTTVAVFNRLKEVSAEFIPVNDILSGLRIIKDESEIASLQKAQNIADKAYAAMLNSIHSGMTEKEVAAELDYLCAKFGSEYPSFDTIVGSGPNGAKCHAVKSDRVLKSGDLVVVDFGCVYNGYHSDMTRTFGVGKLDDKSKDIYKIVLETQLKTMDALKNGISGKDLDAVARDIITSYGYGNDFGHGLGHGFGLEIHEPPRASMFSTDILTSGMTITVEPGIYVEGFCGVRIEDCCIVSDDGKINLVNTSKDLICID